MNPAPHARFGPSTPIPPGPWRWIAIAGIAAGFINGCYTLSLNVSSPTRASYTADGILSLGAIASPHAAACPDTVTQADIKEKLGAPDAVFETRNASRYVYEEGGFRWVGASAQGIIGFIPILLPALVPVGRNHAEYFFDERGNLTGARMRSHEVVFSTGFFHGATDESCNACDYTGAWFGKIPPEVSGWVGWDGVRFAGLPGGCTGRTAGKAADTANTADTAPEN